MQKQSDWKAELTRADRVRQRTAPEVNQKIDQAMEERLNLYTSLPEQVISLRIAELDQELDIERTVVLQAALAAFLGLFLGVRRRRGWLWLAAINQFFLFQQAVSGWCPPVALHRRLGIRTRREIETEKTALKALRGDFRTGSEPAAPPSAPGATLLAASQGGESLPGFDQSA